MNATIILDLINGSRLPQDDIEQIFLYTYVSAITGSKLYEIYLALSDDIDDDDANAIGAILTGYAIAEKQIFNNKVDKINKGEMN
jgi:hypothetical protein